MYIEMIMLLFVIACAYFSYKAGFADGVGIGTDAVLTVLADDNIITLEIDTTGETHIFPGTKQSRPNDT